MIKRSILCLVVIFGFQKLPANQKEKLADSLASYGRSLNAEGEYNLAIRVLEKSFELNSALNRQLQLAKNLNDLGVSYHNLRAYDSAVLCYNRAKEIFLIEGDSSVLPFTLSNLGMIYKRRGDYEEALENLFTALRYDLKLGARASTHNAIGSTYTQTGQYHLAVANYLQAIDFYKEFGNPKRLGIAYNNLGNAFSKMEKFDSAVYYFDLALDVRRSIDDRAGISRVLNNIGLNYLELGDHDKAKIHLQESLNLKKILHDSLGIANTLNLLARINLKDLDLKAARQNLEIANRIIGRMDAPYELRENLRWQAEYYKTRNDWRNESRILKQYISVNDSLLDLEKVKSLAEMQVKYESEKKDDVIIFLEEIEQLQKADLAFQRNMKNIYLLAAGLFGTSLVVVIALFVTNRRKTKLIEQLSQEMQHRIRNNLQILSGILKLQGNSEKVGEAAVMLKESESRVNAMAIVHQMLYTDIDRREIDLQKYVTELSLFLARSFTNGNREIIIDPEVSNIRLDVDRVTSIGLIINELVTNAIKYASEEDAKLIVIVKFVEMDSGNFFLEVRDNGAGLYPDRISGKNQSFGLKLVRMLSKQLNAEFNQFNDEGAVFQFSIPPK